MSQYDPDKHHRRSIRLKGYDYAQAGAYFVTICAQNRECRFGEIADGRMALNDAGRMIQAEWEQLPERFPAVELGAYVVMPNHFHAIVIITDSSVGAGLVPAPVPDGATTNGATITGATTRVAPTNTGDWATTDRATTDRADRATTRVAPTDTGANAEAQRSTLGDVIGAFKSLTTNAYIRGVRGLGWPPFDKRLWQRNYYEHVVRSEDELSRIQRYIENNPANWETDEENPNRRHRRK